VPENTQKRGRDSLRVRFLEECDDLGFDGTHLNQSQQTTSYPGLVRLWGTRERESRTEMSDQKTP
jgi:hypothetical protein